MSIVINQKNIKQRTLYNVKEVPKLPEFAWLTESTLRHLIFKSKPRFSSSGIIAGNGMIEAGVIKRIGKRILIDIDKLHAWVENSCPVDLTMEIK